MESSLFFIRSTMAYLNERIRTKKIDLRHLNYIVFVCEKSNPLFRYLERMDHSIIVPNENALSSRCTIVIVGTMITNRIIHKYLTEIIEWSDLVLLNVPTFTYGTEMINHSSIDVDLFNPTSYGKYRVNCVEKWYDMLLYQDIRKHSELCPVIHFERRTL